MGALRVTAKALLRLALVAAAWLAGCHTPIFSPAYGMQPLYGIDWPPHDPTVAITDFSYTPQSPVHIGDTLSFTTTLNHATDGANLEVAIGQSAVQYAMLQDYGWAPDARAHDGIYSGTLEWQPAFGPITNQPVVVRLIWYDGYPGLELAGPPLTVEEQE